MSDGRVLSGDELVDAYNHAKDFLSEDYTLHKLTNIERALCKSVVGMYATIRDRDKKIAEFGHRLAEHKRIIERAEKQLSLNSADLSHIQRMNTLMRETLEFVVSHRDPVENDDLTTYREIVERVRDTLAKLDNKEV